MEPNQERTAFASPPVRDWRDAELISWKWHAFEWIFGCVLPIVCFAVERDFSFFGRARVLLYPFVCSEIALLAWWKLWPVRSAVASQVVAGALGIGACVAVVIGFVLLPISMLMVIVGIGLLGLAPWGTAAAFVRVCRRTYRYADPGPWISSHAAM